MRASVDKDLCIGCALCTSICPDVFSMEDDGKAVAISGDVPNGEDGSATEARDSCPASAIDIEE